MNTLVLGFSAVCMVLCGRFTSRAVGNTNVLVIIKKMSSRKIISVIEAIENVAIMSWGRRSDIGF